MPQRSQSIVGRVVAPVAIALAAAFRVVYAAMRPKPQPCKDCERDLSRRKHRPGCPLGPPWGD
jgi:hypothetical protein